VRTLVISNPRATATSPRARDVLVHALASETELEIAETANRGHAAALACRAMRAGVDVVVGVGGDGTLNEIVNGLLTDGVHDSVPALGIIPTGSTNVFARALGLPNDPIEATGVLLEALRAGSRRAVSLGKADDRYFLFAAGHGFDANIISRVERHRRRGRRNTDSLYARLGLREWLAYDRRTPKLHVEFGDGVTLDGVFFAMVTNCDPWTFALNRPMRPTPKVNFDNGLGIYARRRMGAAGILFSAARMSARHPRVGRRGAYVVQDVDTMVIWSDEPMALQVDGDFLGESGKVVFTCAPQAVRVVM
jgi:diacylglycerol kinase family enzyme